MAEHDADLTPAPPVARAPHRTREALLGLFALAIGVGAVLATWFFLQGGFEGGVPVSARFSAPGVGQQLPVGGDVKVRGVLVGRIHDIVLDDTGGVTIEMRLNGSESIPEGSSAEIRSKTVFGQKWVELIPTDEAEGPFLEAGDVIPDERTKEPLEFERALQLGHEVISVIPLEDLAQTFNALAEGFTGQEGDARTAIDRGLVALRAVNSRSEELDLSLRQLREFSEWLDENDTDLLSFFESLDEANRALVGAAPEFRSNLASAPVFFEDFAGFFELTEPELGRLVEDGATLAEIIAAQSQDLGDIIVNLESFTTVWNSGLKQPCEGAFESNMTCWQVYQPPGLVSRGLYGPGDAPDADEPGDPLFGVPGESPLADARLQELLTEAARTDLASLLMAPLAGDVP